MTIEELRLKNKVLQQQLSLSLNCELDKYRELEKAKDRIKELEDNQEPDIFDFKFILN